MSTETFVFPELAQSWKHQIRSPVSRWHYW